MSTHEPAVTPELNDMRRDALARVHAAITRDRELHRDLHRAGHDLVAAVLAARAAGLSDHEIARALVPASGDPAATNRARRKLARALRERVRRAARKATHRGADLRPPATSSLRDHGAGQQDGVEENKLMTHDPYLRRRIIEEYGPPPDVAGASPMDDEDDEDDAPALGGGPELVGCDDDLDDDEDSDDEDDPE